MDKDLYRALTKLKYSIGGDEKNISELINDILKDHFHTYALSKSVGRILVSKYIMQRAIDKMPDEDLNELAIENAEEFKEAALIEHGKASLDAYLKVVKAFAKANRFYVELSKNPDNGNQVLVTSFHMGEKFSKLKGETYKRLLEEFAEIDRMEIAGSVLYLEFKPKKEEVLPMAPL